MKLNINSMFNERIWSISYLKYDIRGNKTTHYDQHILLVNKDKSKRYIMDVPGVYKEI